MAGISIKTYAANATLGRADPRLCIFRPRLSKYSHWLYLCSFEQQPLLDVAIALLQRLDIENGTNRIG